jgi:hypothetical protein
VVMCGFVHVSVARLENDGRMARGLVAASVGRLGCLTSGLLGISRCCLASRLQGRATDDDRFLLGE